MGRTHEGVVSVLDDEGRDPDQREDLAHVEGQDRAHLCDRGAGGRREALDPAVPLLDPGIRGDRRSEVRGGRPRPPRLLDLCEQPPGRLGRHPCGIVVGPREPREAVDKDERGHPVRMRRGGHERHLNSVAVGDQSRLLRACGIHHGADIVHPLFRRDRVLDHTVGETDTAHVEPEHAGVTVQRRDELLDERLLPDRLEVARPVEHEHDVAGTLADRLVGEVDVTAFRIQRPRRGHAPFVSQRRSPA